MSNPASPRPQSHFDDDGTDDDVDNLSPAHLIPPQITVQIPTPPSIRKTTKRKKPTLTPKLRNQALEKQHKLLSHNFNPKVFPTPTFDVNRHMALLRSLDLLDFAQLKFDAELRPDLLAELVANYDRSKKCSLVCEKRILVGRAPLAKALKLPSAKPKKEKPGDSENLKNEKEDSVATVVMDFFVKFMMPPVDEDVGIMPEEYSEVQKLASEGSAHKVDWAGLIWGFVEKELLNAPETGSCYFASHLQCLIRHQHPKLFEEERGAVTGNGVEAVQETENSGDVEAADEMEEKAVHEMEENSGDVEAVHEKENSGDAEVAHEAEENSVDVTMAEEEMDDECQDGNAIAKDEDINDVENTENIEITKNMENTQDAVMGLSLCIGGNAVIAEEGVMDGSGEGDEAGEEQWILDKKDVKEVHCFRRCNSNVMGSGVKLEEFGSHPTGSMEFGDLYKDDGEGKEEEVEEFNHVFGKFPLGRMNSSGLIQSLDAMHSSYNQQMNSIHMPSDDFLAMKVDGEKEMVLDHDNEHCGEIFYNHNGKRPIEEIEEDDDDDHNAHEFSHYNQQKRMRTDAVWEQIPPDFDSIMELAECSLKKSRFLFQQKEEEIMNGNRQIQMLNEMLQDREQYIQSMERTRAEDRQKMLMEVRRYEHELNAMKNLVIGYKKALKQTRASFEVYRKKFPQGDEPLYKDVAGSGGLVLTAKELEKLNREKEEQMRCQLKVVYDQQMNAALTHFEEYNSRIDVFNSRVIKISEEFTLLKESAQKLKNPDN